TVTLPKATDFKPHRVAITPPFKAKGRYAVLASERQDFGVQDNQVVGLVMEISDLVVIGRRGKAFGVTVVDGAHGEPVSGAEVRLFAFGWEKPKRLLTTAKTDANGDARIARPARPSNDEDSDYQVVVKNQGDRLDDAVGVSFQDEARRGDKVKQSF